MDEKGERARGEKTSEMGGKGKRTRQPRREERGE